MTWWVLTDPSSTGTCERCKRPAAEHTWKCGLCLMAGRRQPQYLAKAILGKGDSRSFRTHTYQDHPPGAYGGVVLCHCPDDAIPKPPPAPAAPPGQVVQPQLTREEHLRAAMERARANAAALAGESPAPAAPTQAAPRATGSLQCACPGCGGCTGGVSCARPPDGDHGRCMVCSFLGPKAAKPAPASVASTIPAPPEVVEGVEEPVAGPASPKGPTLKTVEVDAVVVPDGES